MTTYAIADQVPEGCDYLTAGKEYEVIHFTDHAFQFIDDKGGVHGAFWFLSIHLNGGNWRRVEK